MFYSLGPRKDAILGLVKSRAYLNFDKFIENSINIGDFKKVCTMKIYSMMNLMILSLYFNLVKLKKV